MEYALRSILFEDREAIMDIFNHYVENSFTAYPGSKLSYQAFDLFLRCRMVTHELQCSTKNTRLLDSVCRAHHMLPTFSHTAEVTNFIPPDHTGRGIDRRLLESREEGARETGIKTILANITSLNEASIQFHEKNGFVEVGRLMKVGRKLGQEFDTVWMQKML